VVEVDGLYHSRRAALDERRDRALVRAGCHVLRLSNELVMLDRGRGRAASRGVGSALVGARKRLPRSMNRSDPAPLPLRRFRPWRQLPRCRRVPKRRHPQR
jgi:hypothetical protein